MIVVDNKEYNNRDFKPLNYFLFSNAQYFLPSCRNFIPVTVTEYLLQIIQTNGGREGNHTRDSRPYFRIFLFAT